MITPLIAYFASRAQADDARIFAKKVFTIRKLIFFAIHKKGGHSQISFFILAKSYVFDDDDHI